ncbi:MAG: arginine--tRNA ligase [Candidatus Aenigmarchaeota archaeon]|nr:arginine--tRNA ligase [Candidatus Aenigmarchaeota archaeon]
MTLLEEFQAEVRAVVARAAHIPRDQVTLEAPPPDIDADLAFPCFSLAKKYRKAPPLIAQELAGKIKPRGLIRVVTSQGPYLNFTADWAALGSRLLKAAAQPGWGKAPARKERILVEYAQPNTHKAFHIGHCRNIVLGEALCRVLEHAGCAVIRVNYQGDIGPHVAKVLWGLQHLKPKEPAKGKGRWLGEVYALASKAVEGHPKKEEEVRELNKQLYARDKRLVQLWEKTRKWSLEDFQRIYQDFGVSFRRLYFEGEVEARGAEISRNLLTRKVAKLSQGAIVMDLEKEGLGIWVLLTQDQTPLYSAKDFALAELQEKEFHPSQLIHVVAAEQQLHFRQLIASLGKFSPALARKEVHLPYELVNLSSGKMSSRTGDIITYDELREEVVAHALEVTQQHSKEKNLQDIARQVGMGAIVYDLVKQSPEKVIVFDWAQALSFDGNAAPYLQYTCARARSIMEKAGAWGPGFHAALLNDKRERLLLRTILAFPDEVLRAARDRRPHYLANYAYHLATCFNEFYQNLSVLRAEPGEREARLALVRAVHTTLATALQLLGIQVPEKM